LPLTDNAFGDGISSQPNAILRCESRKIHFVRHASLMKIISANLNGIRSASSKGFLDWLQNSNADVVCVQELKAQSPDLTDAMKNPPGFHGFFHCAEKKGYSGVGIYSRVTPDRVIEGVGHAGIDAEGRFIRADFGALSVVSVYVPSGSSGSERQQAKFDFLDVFLPFMSNLRQEGREFVICGDWNIAHAPIDLKNWKGNLKNSGFLPAERQWLDTLYASGWSDVYRQLCPESGESGYTWWSNRGQAYAKNVGWRIDLHVATAGIAAQARAASIYKDQRFSDHAPLIIDYDFATP
jgi:exodeoxyribonuclease III